MPRIRCEKLGLPFYLTAFRETQIPIYNRDPEEASDLPEGTIELKGRIKGVDAFMVSASKLQREK